MLRILLATLLTTHAAVNAAITVLGETPLGQMSTITTRTAAGPLETYAAYDDTLLAAPALPNPMPALGFVVGLPGSGNNVVGIASARAIKGSFWGFSIEMSVMNQVCNVVGKNSSFIPPPFLNLMSNLVERAGSVNIRCGGNTQEKAVLVAPDAIGNGSTFDKQLDENSQATTQTPHVVFTEDWFYMLSNISTFVPGVGWYVGIPFNQTQPFRLQIAEYAEKIMGEHLLGFQCANEPDFYIENGNRIAPYTPYDYFGEFADLVNQINANPNIPIKNNLIGPSVAGPGHWLPEDVFATGYLDAFRDYLTTVSIENYSNDNCGAKFGNDFSKNLQEIFPSYLTHQSPQRIIAQFTSASQTALAYGKEMVMFETNTASCGGFAGISDSFGATLWALDYGMQMAYHNFSHALLHVGGQNDHYNAFTAPPTNQSEFNQWTIGAVYYSVLSLAEAVGNSGTARFVDVQGNGGNEFTPQYAIYESDGQGGELRLSKMALFNYMTDPNGAANLQVTIQLNDGVPIPAQVGVKYLRSSSVSNKNDITWGGQTFGTKFNVDGRLQGELQVDTIACNPADNTCNVPVPAPGFALVFFDQAFAAQTIDAQTYSTTAATRTRNTATVAPSVVETSNGHNGTDRESRTGGTSPANSAIEVKTVSLSLGAIFVGVAMIFYQ